MESIWRRRAKQTLPGAALLLYLAGLLLESRAVSAAVTRGLGVCGRVLIPALFPFLVFSGLACSTGLMARLGAALGRPMKALFHLPGSCAGPLAIGLAGGYPLGVQAVIGLYRQGGCSREQAERLLGFCACCSPGFLLVTAGKAVFSSVKIGLLLLAIHWFSAFLAGFLLTRRLAFQSFESQPSSGFSSLSSAFPGAVQSAVGSMAMICGFYLWFRVVLALLEPALARLPLPGLRSLAMGALEMSCGILSLSGSLRQLPIAAAILGWGGLSVHGQTLSLLTKTDLSPRYYWKGKVLHSLLSFLLCCLFLLLFQK